MPAILNEAACDGVVDCALVDLPDRGACGVHVPLTPPLTRVVVRSYTARPGVTVAPHGANCSGIAARFMLPNETDPASPDSPLWAVRRRSGFAPNGAGGCSLETPPQFDGSVMVIEIRGNGTSAEFSREIETREDGWFEVGEELAAAWVDGYARLAIELDQTHQFPACCELPANFTDSEGRVWVQTAYEGTCGKIDSAEYAYVGAQPTLTSAHSSTQERWRFEISAPVSPCGMGPLFASTKIADLLVPIDSPLTPPPTPPLPRYLTTAASAGAPGVIEPAIWILAAIVSSGVLAAAILLCALAMGKKKKKKVKHNDSE